MAERIHLVGNIVRRVKNYFKKMHEGKFIKGRRKRPKPSCASLATKKKKCWVRDRLLGNELILVNGTMFDLLSMDGIQFESSLLIDFDSIEIDIDYKYNLEEAGKILFKKCCLYVA